MVSIHFNFKDVFILSFQVYGNDDGSKALKLGDFGLATEVKGLLYVVCGTPTYVAPEVLAETGLALFICKLTFFIGKVKNV